MVAPTRRGGPPVPAIFQEILKGEGTRARALRSAGFILIGFGGQNILRLASNLILTRLLFPEAFGLMSLVMVFLTGLALFSDLGVNVSIMQHKRGEDRDFLNTAWTMQIIRGVIIWLVCCLIAWPAALIYNEPRLAELLPVAGLTSVITGFTTTRVAVMNRNLQIGVQVMTGLGTQALGILFTVVLTWFWRDVWALVFGSMLSFLTQNYLLNRLLPGERNKLCWDRDAVHSMLHFGKYIFLSSIAGFLSNQGDRAVLGGYVSMADLGIYTVGFTMAQLSLQLIRAAGSKVLLPLNRQFMQLDVPENRAKVFRARRMLLAGGMVGVFLMTVFGVPLIHFLYDSRYDQAGPILVLMGIPITLQIASSLYDGVYLAHGDSKTNFYLNGWRALCQTILLFVGVSQFGILGAIAAQALGTLLVYPLQAIMTRRYHGWDRLADALVVLTGGAAVVIAFVLFQDDMSAFLSWSLAATK